jgi:hypothetical protein
MGDESERGGARESSGPVVDDLPLSPELVLVSPPDQAQRARAGLAEPALPSGPREAALSRGEVVAAYAVALAVTLVPFAVTVLSLPSR